MPYETDAPDVTFDGETVCPGCDVVICAYCQGTGSHCDRVHKPKCPIAACLFFRPHSADDHNALPKPVRNYIHWLATRADPAGDLREIASLKEQREALTVKVGELIAELEQLRRKDG